MPQQDVRTIQRAKALLDMGAMRINHGAGAYAVVYGEKGPIGVIASSCAAILGLSFDIVDGHDPFQPGEYRSEPAVLIAMFARDPSRDEIQQLVLRTMRHAPLSLLVVRARGRDVEAFADEMRSAHEEFLCTTCHY